MKRGIKKEKIEEGEKDKKRTLIPRRSNSRAINNNNKEAN